MALNFEAIDNKILGWLSKDEADILYKYAIDCPLNRVLEIGSFVGRSTAVLATAMKDKSGTVITIDTFPNNCNFCGKNIVIPNTLKTFWENIASLGFIENVIAIKGDTAQVLPTLMGRFGLIFIDGGHTVKNVIHNALYAFDNVVKDGYIIFHDYGNKDWPDVKICVDVLSKKWGIEPEIHGLIAVFKKGE